MKHSILMMVAALLLCNFRCGDEPDTLTQVFDLDKAFEVRTGVTYSERNGPLTLNLNSIISDGRCPKDVTCFSAGSTEAAFFFQDNKQQEMDTLSSVSHGQWPDSALFQGYKIKFVEVAPEAISTVTIQQAEYRLKMIVTK